MPDRYASSDIERREFVGALARQRKLLRRTVQGLSEEQVRLRPTASSLCLGGLIKHVTLVEQSWSSFITRGASAFDGDAAASFAERATTFDLTEDETMPAVLERYGETTRGTDDLIMRLPSLDVAHPLPDAPWFERGASWSARRVLLHIMGETSQHAGHADIIRESIDGAKTLG
jgi:uncharacterized damage-inducible protein DinB